MKTENIAKKIRAARITFRFLPDAFLKAPAKHQSAFIILV